MALRLELHHLQPDPRLTALQRPGLRLSRIDVWTLDRATPDLQALLPALARRLGHPLTAEARLPGAPHPALPADLKAAIEIGFLPGVTDNAGRTASEILALLAGPDAARIHASQVILLAGTEPADPQALAAALHNPLIQHARILSGPAYRAGGGFTPLVPEVRLRPVQDPVLTVSLDLEDEALRRIGRAGIPGADGQPRGPLGLDLADLQAIRSHFRSLGRDPSDVELECLAQTWSEHCKHRLFNAPLPGVRAGLYRSFIRRATETIRARRGSDDPCVSVFTDNAGGIRFAPGWVICDKVETHNSPSALDPFGGAMTGILGVNRDVLGFGRGARPIANRFGFCLADPRDPTALHRRADGSQPMLSARRIADGVIQGVEAGGNQSGIPTPLGFVQTHPRWRGKPLVFCGTVGLLPEEIAGRKGWEKAARPGDLIVMAGGRVGLDGIHGATFSSVALDEGSPATAVQIGDSLTQKRLMDLLLGPARERGLWRSLTDNGAGGLSSSIGEMAEQSGGFTVDLETVPLKYPGMAPWQIWISESQERMTLAVAPDSWPELQDLARAAGVEATAIGVFTATGQGVVRWHGQVVMDLALDFLHRGAPEKRLPMTAPAVVPAHGPRIALTVGEALPALLAMPGIGSRRSIHRLFDHEVQGTSLLKPLQGPGEVAGEAAALRPLPDRPEAVILAQGLQPLLGERDAYAMALAAMDRAVRAAIAAGADPKRLAVLDNFCWPSGDRPERLWQLAEAARGCHDAALALDVPFISGKDSMFNDFQGYDDQGQAMAVQSLPTLLISAIGVAADWRRVIGIDARMPGDPVYLLGLPGGETGGSAWEAATGSAGGLVPRLDPALPADYARLAAAIRAGLVASAIASGDGGLAVAAAKMALAGDVGLALLDLPEVPMPAGVAEAALLYGESPGLVLLTAAPGDAPALEAAMAGSAFHRIGVVSRSRTLSLRVRHGNTHVWDLPALAEAYAAADVWA